MERPILTSTFSCKQAEKYLIAFREGIYCKHATAHMNCQALSQLLRKNAQFALQLPSDDREIPHGKDLKLKCGGLTALMECLDTTDNDIHSLVSQAMTTYKSLENLPFSEMITTIQHYKIRGK
jgi:hypothetical protein